MARFYAEIQGSRGEATRLGGVGSGIRGHIRGWDVGVRVSGFAKGQRGIGEDGRDVFSVEATGGSHGGASTVHIAEVEQLAGGGRLVTLSEKFGGGRFVISSDGGVSSLKDCKHAGGFSHEVQTSV